MNMIDFTLSNLLIGISAGTFGVFLNWVGNNIYGKPGSVIIFLSAVLMLVGAFYCVVVATGLLLDGVAM